MRKQLFRLLSRLPFGVLYCISDFIYLVLYYIVGYRKRVVRMNLKNAFPEKNEKELRQIEKGFYHFLCDYGVESLKLLTISPEEMKEHMVFENTEAIDDALNDHNFVFVYIGHYCNWEWMSSLPLWARKDATLGELYRPLKSKVMDELFIDLRQHFNAECISKYEALRHIMRFKAENKKCIIGFVADQTPHPDNTHLWMDFLSQDTPIFTGTERIGKKVDAAIFFADLYRVKRGHYRCTFKEITRNIKQFPDYQITERCTQELEQIICRQPEYWLWSHKRWKHKRNKNALAE
ncbi:MAG: lysophospholipid acyltransferase family protein [Bacteroidaceae bacterium]|nr:lysophospholipid acyltransferase family protein [Bacteroidaceae bacterium]